MFIANDIAQLNIAAGWTATVNAKINTQEAYVSRIAVSKKALAVINS